MAACECAACAPAHEARSTSETFSACSPPTHTQHARTEPKDCVAFKNISTYVNANIATTANDLTTLDVITQTRLLIAMLSEQVLES